MIMRTLYQYAVIGLLLLWIVVSAVRTVSNFSKIFTEEKEWMGLSDYQKNNKYFGNIFSLLYNTSKYTSSNSRIGFYSGGREFYLGRYELYPRRTIWYHTPQELIANLKTRNIQYAIVYGKNLSSNKLFRNLHLTIITQTNDKKGTLYKL